MDPSFNELKYSLQNQLQKEGMVETMRTQLRYKLLEKLQLQQKKVLAPNQSPSQTETLPRRVAASMVADFLRAAGLEYCLSVFLPESGYNGSLLERDELSILLKVDSQELKQQGVLQTLCQDLLLHKPREAPKTNSSTQTYTGDAIMSLEQKLNQVDTAFRQKIEGELLKPHQDIEERVQRIKRDLELRMKAEMQAEMAKFREFEIQNIKLEEADKHRMRLQEYREELEKNYQERLQKLRDREKDIMDKAANKTKEIENMNYNYRQKIMRETEILRMKEQEVQKERELNEEQLKAQKQRLELKERELQKKLSELDQQKLDFDRKYKNDIHMNKLSVLNEVHDETEELRQKQRQIELDMIKIDQLKETVENLTRENKQLAAENEKYVEQIKELKRKKKDLQYDHDGTKDQLRTLSDVQRRDQELSRKYENDLKLKDQELLMHKKALEHKDDLISEHKQLHQDYVQKLQREISDLQQKVEQQELLIKDLNMQVVEKDKENYVPKQNTNPSIQIPGGVMDSLMLHYNIADHQNRINLLHRELEENKIRRQEEARRLREDWFVDKPAFNTKFQDAWDLHGSSIDFSQGPSLFRKQPHQQMYHTQESQALTGSKVKVSEDPMNIFRMEDAQSQVLQSEVIARGRHPRNVIEEAYSDDG